MDLESASGKGLDTWPTEVLVELGRSVRRLPVLMPPQPGESFPSWIDRNAHALEIGPGQLVRRLGMVMRPVPGKAVPAFYGVSLPPDSLRRLREATGLTIRQLTDMHLTRYDGTALDLSGLDWNIEASMRSLWAGQWVQLHSSRACPRCLADSEAWPLWWRLESAACCPVHGCLLVSVCPACQIPLRRGNPGVPRPLSAAPGRTDPVLCGNRAPGQPGGACGQRLSELPTVPLPATVVAVQRTALAAAEGHRLRLGGERVSGAEWLGALRFMTALLRRTATTDDAAGLPPVVADAFAARLAERHAKGPGAGHLSGGPADAAEAAALWALAAPVLLAPKPSIAVEALRPWAERLAAYRRQTRVADPLRNIPRPDALDRLLRQATPRARRVSGAPKLTAALELRHIPHLLPELDYQAWIIGHLPGSTDPASGRRLGALALAQLAGAGTTWVQAGDALGMDPERARRAARYGQRVADEMAFWADVTQLAAVMRERGLTDYDGRRRALAGLRSIPLGVMESCCRPVAMRVTERRARYAAVWAWAQLTGGDWRDAPGFDPAGACSARANVQGWWRFREQVLPGIAAPLEAWGLRLLGGEVQL